MGHAPPNMTDRYVYLNMSKLREELEKLPWLMPYRAQGADILRFEGV